MMEVISFHIPKLYLRKLEYLVELNLFPNRSEAIRIAIRDLIIKEESRIEKKYIDRVLEDVRSQKILTKYSNIFQINF